MKLHVLGSSSSGNCYLLDNETECLIIESGIHFSEVKKAMDFNIRKIVGCILTHEHSDHAKWIGEFISSGVPVFTSRGTMDALKLNPHFVTVVEHAKKVQIGSFEVMPFDIIHDAAQPFGYIIKHPSCGKVLFLTDTHYSEYTFRGLNHILVESNYSKPCLEQAISDGRTPEFLRHRIESSHMSLDTTKELLSANDLSKVRNIVLIHLSANNSNHDQFKEEVQKLTGKEVHIARRGLSIPFDLNPF